MGILGRAALVPLTEQELADAKHVIESDGICIAHIQRRLRIGWNRAADLAEAIIGLNALPDVAKQRYADR